MADPPSSDTAIAARLLDVTGTAIVVLDRAGVVQLVNRSGAALLDLPSGAIVGRDWFELAEPPESRADARATFVRMLGMPREHEEAFESLVRRPEGADRVVEWRSALLTDEDGAIAGVVRSGRDVTGLRSGYDSVTELPDASLLEEHLSLAVARARRHGSKISLVAFDLDDFTAVNDAWGRSTGDDLLRQVAMRVREATRANDLLARTGGDEFVLLLADLDDAARDAAVVVSRLVRRSLRAPFDAGGLELTLQGTIGIAVFPDDADNAEDLLQAAATAVEHAKRRRSRRR